MGTCVGGGLSDRIDNCFECVPSNPDLVIMPCLNFYGASFYPLKILCRNLDGTIPLRTLLCYTLDAGGIER